MSKIQLKEFVYFGKLFACYGKLLSEDRQAIMTSYFEYNMTLAEIAKERNVSRQAVLDAIDKSCEKLANLEKTLCIVKQKEEITDDLNKLAESCPEIKEKVDLILRKM